MKSMKMRGIAAAVTGALLFGFGANAMADSSVDIVNALVAKGVLTEEEGALITKGAKEEKAANAKAIKKAGKVTMSDAIENATIYGDIRARYERRDADVLDNSGINAQSNRERYKVTLGVTTKSGNAYSDLAMSMGDNVRSDNTSFGDNATAGDFGNKTKSTLFVKRAMFGYNVTPWLAVEAGRMKNPLFMVNAMVFDHDIVVDGLQEKLNYKLSDSTTLFANLGQWVYSGKENATSNAAGTSSASQRQNMLLAFQGGAKNTFIDKKLSGTAAVGYYNYTAQASGVTAAYKPGLGNATAVADYGVNDLQILDIPAEVNYMVNDTIGVRPYAEYAVNLNADDRKAAACRASSNYCNLSNDDTAWLVGLTVGSASDLKSFEGKKMAKGDWSANLWYQSVGAYSLNQNAVDSDIFDGRLNMEGTSLKAQYNVEDNIALNFTGSWGSRKNSQYSTQAPKVDITGNIDNYTLYQFDVTYKF